MSADRDREEAMMREVLRFAIEPPAPGLVDRVLAAVAEEPEPRRATRPQWAFGLVATALAAALVVTLVFGARAARLEQAPASHGVPPGSSAGGLPLTATGVQPFLTAAGGGWLARQDGGRSTLYQSPDGGATWVARLAYDGGPPSQVIVYPDGTGIVVGGQAPAAGPVLFRTTDGGASWQHLPTPPFAAQAWGPPYFADATHGRVLASLGPDRAEILSTSDGGTTWSAAPAFNDRANFPGLSSVRLRIVWTADGRGVAVSPAGSTGTLHVVITDDGGATWRSSFPQAPRGVNVQAGGGVLDPSLLPDGRGVLFLQAPVTGRGGAPALYAYATGDAGRTWAAPVRLAGPEPGMAARAAFALDAAHWWASAGSGADLLVTADGGRTIQRHTGAVPAGYAFRSLSFRSDAEGWAMASAPGGRNALFATDDGGATWRPLASPV